MSAIPTQVSAELFAYLTARTTPEDPFLATLRTEAEAAGLPAIWISPEQAVFLQILLRLGGATKVLELGTLAGYSAIAMAKALPQGGRLDTIEICNAHADFAQEKVNQAGLAQCIRIHRSAALDLLPSFGNNSFDAIFIDADKANYARYLHEGMRVVRPGGMILVDNAFAFGRILEDATSTDDVWAIRALNDVMARQDGLQALIIPVGDGLWVGVKSH